MSSRFLPNIYKQDGGLPRTSGWKGFNWEADGDQSSKRGQCSHTPPQGQPYCSAPRYRHGLTTPPSDGGEMNGSCGHTLPNPNNGGQQRARAPVVASNAPSYPIARLTSDNSAEKGPLPRQAPFYDSYYSANRPQSPVLPLKNAQSEHTARRRRASSDSNSIASHLQIPPSINDSRGSLPEFAAQITCLFWFESSSTIYLVEDITSSPMPTTPLVPEAMPTTGFRKWVTTILSMTQVSQNVILLALMFIYRLKKLNPGVKGKLGSEFRLLTVALMLGNKFLDDNTYTNKTWAEVSGISVQEIHVMEVEFLSNMRYTLYASEKEWKAWHAKLGKFSDYYDKATQTQIGLRNFAFPAPQYNTHRDLPSPPVSTNTSPPFLTRHEPSIATLPHPLSMPPYLAPRIPSPTTPMSEVDLKNLCNRKRSVDDHTSDPPAKRLNSLGPSAASSTTLAQSTLRNNNTSVPRLPMPVLSTSAGHQTNGYNSSPAQLPMPFGRAMSSVFPGSNSRPQSGLQLPSLQPPNYFNQPANARGSSPLEYPSRQTPYSTAASTPSPTTYAFPPHQSTPNGLSPSGRPAPRDSPYKPMRGVNTLLVPPPSASIQNQPQNISYGQMHYQPLGKPASEQRTGVLPYFPFNTFSQPHHMQNYLPQPSFAS